MTNEIRITSTMPGVAWIIVLFVLQVLLIVAIGAAPHAWKLIPILASVVNFVCWFGFYVVQPNQGKVLTLFGRYVGTDRESGLHWANPFYSKKRVSLRVRNFESGKLKVNDANGNPIEIAAIIVWRVVDTAEAIFEVDNYENYVTIQSESALRNLATSYPYEDHGDDHKGLTLRSNSNEIALKLKEEVAARLQKAGVEVMEARLSHLAYAPEIAQAMLQRQQASAILGARKIIVQGAVGIVHAALEQLKSLEVVELDAERKAAMVSNLLVVLCGDQKTQPVINAGSLY
ncbi:MAG TPA: SPFH domain-containing protein [Candidatus Acidoferrum sp.]|nr:SPFH domain-containing protein [Candidatus Acidoferrum sp.]